MYILYENKGENEQYNYIAFLQVKWSQNDKNRKPK